MARQDGPSYVPGQLLAMVTHGLSDEELSASLKRVNGKVLKRFSTQTLSYVLIEVSNETLEQSLRLLAVDPNFEAVQLNYLSSRI